jgi:hypothetical protein
VQGRPYHKMNQPLRKPQDMVNLTTTRPEEPHKRPSVLGALRPRIACAPPWVSMPLHKSDLAIRTERNPHVLIHSLARHRGIHRSTND